LELVSNLFLEARMRSSRRKDPAKASLQSQSSAPSTNAKRRGFLLALGAGGAGAAALAARSLTSVAPAAGTAPEAEERPGYRLTDHVKRYYQTTKL
jgi:hypothetical protein